MKLHKTSQLLSAAIVCGLLGISGIAAAQTNFPPYNTVHLNPSDTTNKVFTAVEVEPVPQGGMDAFYSYLGKNIRYPSLDKKFGIQGRVVAQFVVEKDGSLTDIKIIRTPSNTLANETIRVLKLSPNWTPGLQNDSPVRVQYTIPLNFSMDAENSTNTDLNTYFAGHIRYPEKAKNANISGFLIITLSIDKKHINAASVQKGINADLDEAVRQTFQSYTNEINAENGNYSIVLHFGPNEINTNELASLAQNLNVVDLIRVPKISSTFWHAKD